MDGGVNGNGSVRALAGSGIPTPQSLLKSPKLNLKRLDSGLRQDARHLPIFPKVSSSRVPAKPNQLLLQKSGPSLCNAPYRATGISEIGSHAHSASRKEALKSHKASLSLAVVRELKRDVNENCPTGYSGHGGVDNADSWVSNGRGAGGAAPPSVSRVGEDCPSRLSNQNQPGGKPAGVQPGVGHERKAHLEQTDPGGFTDEEMDSPEEAVPKFCPPRTTPLSRRPTGEGVRAGGSGAHPPPQLNMVAVAPFRHR